MIEKGTSEDNYKRMFLFYLSFQNTPTYGPGFMFPIALLIFVFSFQALFTIANRLEPVCRE